MLKSELAQSRRRANPPPVRHSETWIVGANSAAVWRSRIAESLGCLFFRLNLCAWGQRCVRARINHALLLRDLLRQAVPKAFLLLMALGQCVVAGSEPKGLKLTPVERAVVVDHFGKRVPYYVSIDRRWPASVWR
jgi:hypothetical protein